MGNLVSAERSYKDRVVWVIGASSGIGEAVATQLHSEGAYLILSARSKSKLELLRTALLSKGSAETEAEAEKKDAVAVLDFDISDLETLKDVVRTAIDVYASIDVVVLASGISSRSSVIDTDFTVQQRLMQVNYFGPIAVTKHLLPHFLEQSMQVTKGKRPSCEIVVLSSIQGKIGLPNRSAYAGSKHALHGFYDSLRSEVSHLNVHVLLCVLGYVNTNLSRNALTENVDTKHAVLDKTTATGFSKEYAAQKIIKAMKQSKEEVIISQLSGYVGILLKNLWPSLLSFLMKRRGRKTYEEANKKQKAA